jgi:uncharacterized glyoxalase superfamily protein PhnB
MPTQVFHPTLRYRDARAAIAWLEKAFGFERKAVYDGEDGMVQHAELRFRDGLIMLGCAGDPSHSEYAKIAPPPGTGSVYVVVDDPDALHDRVVAAGGDVVMPLTDQDYGSRDFAVRDPEGNLWSFGTYDPNAA